MKTKRRNETPLPCRQCIIIRYFLLAAAIGIVLLPVANSRLQVLSHLSAWHFVGLIWGIGVLGMIAKYILDRPSPPSSKTE